MWRSSRNDLSAFFHARICGKGTYMTKDKDNKANDDVIICTDEAGMQLYLSENAANRLSWILTGVMILISLPVIILAFMMI